MIIISDCLTSKADEGCLKVANSLTNRLKAADPETLIISYGRKPTFSDKHMELNKLFLNRSLFSIIQKAEAPVLYIPFASNTTASILRVFALSLFNRNKINVIFVLRFQMNLFAKTILRMSRAKVIALSKESHSYYKSVVGKNSYYLKTGIDTEKFIPVGLEQKEALKKKYAIPENMKVVLHVGHLKTGRNIEILEYIDEKYFVLLILSSVTIKERNDALRTKLENRANTRILDSYIENIQEAYQLADVYLFPVLASENCIDIPLSVLEAAACNIPLVTTAYGELKELIHAAGFYQLKTCSKSEMNSLIDSAVNSENIDTRKAVADYDWKKSISKLKGIIEQR